MVAKIGRAGCFALESHSGHSLEYGKNLPARFGTKGHPRPAFSVAAAPRRCQLGLFDERTRLEECRDKTGHICGGRSYIPNHTRKCRDSPGEIRCLIAPEGDDRAGVRQRDPGSWWVVFDGF